MYGAIMADDTINSSTTNETDELHDYPWLITLRFVVVGLGVVLNGSVTTVFIYIRMYKKSLLHGLIVQQSFLDLFVCVTFLFFYNQDAPDGTAGGIFCKARGLFWFVASTSTYNLVIITMERYVAVVHPITYRVINIEKRSCLFYIIPYIIGFIIAFHLVFIADINKELVGECKYFYPNRAASLTSGLVIFLSLFLMPTCFMIYCYWKIFSVLRNRANARKKQQSTVKNHISVRRNLVYTMFLIVVCFFFTTSPNFTMYLVYIICQCFEFSTIIEHELTVLLYTCNMCINPIVYGAMMTEFKRGLRRMCCRVLILVGCKVTEESTSSTGHAISASRSNLSNSYELKTSDKHG